jgi:N-acyl-D-amino-acid deacylase
MKLKRLYFLIFFILGMLFSTGSIYAPPQRSSFDYDVLIKNGRVVDGSLRPSFKAEVAVKDGKIVKVAKSIRGKASKIIDAKGLYVTPGFIDLHTHVDENMHFSENRPCLNYLTQGVTTVVIGQCGESAWPIFDKAEDWIKTWSKGIGPNAALLVGHETVREIVMGVENREPTPDELEKMKALVKEAMEQGACGLSTGLVYIPGKFAKTDELIELVKVIGPYGGIYHTHTRNEGDKLIEAVKEAVEIAEQTGVPTHISHFKAIGYPNWGLVKEACVLIEEARARGLKITADQYPYRFHSGYPYQSLIPRGVWVGEEGIDRLETEDVLKIFDYLRDEELIELYTKITPHIPLSEHHQQFLSERSRKELVRFVSQSFLSPARFQGPTNTRERRLFLKRMKNPEEAQKIRTAVRQNIEREGGAGNIVVAICVEKELEGKSLKYAASKKKKPVEDTAIELELMGARCIPLQMSEEDIEFIMKKDYVSTGSDGVSKPYGVGLTHIRSYSTFLHKIKKYALQRKTVSLAHVIRSQTSLPAEIMNWDDRGWIKKGYKADITVLDLNNIKTPTSVSNPHQYSEGVKYLLINGEVVIDNGKYNRKLLGQVLKLKK